MLTDFEYETIAGDQLEAFKQILNQHKDGALHPVALLIGPTGKQLMVVMEFRSPAEEEIVLAKLVNTVRSAGATAVILFGTANTFIPAYGNDPVPFLFASILESTHKQCRLGPSNFIFRRSCCQSPASSAPPSERGGDQRFVPRT